MKIKDIKEEMLRYVDFYGGDIPDTDAIKKSKTKKELNDIIEGHRKLLENTLCDALSHLDNFKKNVGLD